MRLAHAFTLITTILAMSGCIPKAEQNSVIVPPACIENTAHSTRELIEEAIFEYDQETFKKFLSENASIDKNEMLALAVVVGRPNIMKILLEAGADPNYLLTEGGLEANLLFIPSYVHSIDVPKVLIESGTDIHFRTSTGLTALHAAVEIMDIEKAALFIRHGINVNARSLKGNTPLHTATGKATTLDFYLKTYVPKDITFSSEDKKNLEQHLKTAQLEMVSMLLAKGANPNAANQGKLTPIHSAASYGRAQVVSKLISYNADVNALDGQGWTPLAWAINADDLETVRVLLANGADPKKATTPYSSPLHMSVIKGNLDVTRVLLSHGAKIDHPIVIADGKHGITPLHIAASNNFPKIARLLIQQGADVTIKTSDEQTILDIINEKPERREAFIKSGVFWEINDALYNAM